MSKMDLKTDDKMSSRKLRRPKFTSGEIEVLKEQVGLRKTILFGSFSNSITKLRKNKEWMKVADEINKVGTSGRTLSEIKKSGKTYKWSLRARWQVTNLKQ